MEASPKWMGSQLRIHCGLIYKMEALWWNLFYHFSFLANNFLNFVLLCQNFSCFACSFSSYWRLMEWLWCTERKKWSVWNRVIYSTLIYFDIIGGSIVLKWFVNRKFCSCTYGFQDRRIWITTFRRMWDGNIRKSGGRQIRGWSIGGVFVFISEFEFFGDITFLACCLEYTVWTVLNIEGIIYQVWDRGW